MKHILFAVFFICLAFQSFAQLSLGFSGGPNVSFPKWYIKPLDTDLNYESSVGWRAAVIGEWQLAPVLALRGEIARQSKGRKNEGTIEPGAERVSINDKFQYWEGSLMMQVSPLKKIPFAYLLAGCSAGQLVSGTSKVKGAFFAGTEKTTRSIDIEGEGYNRHTIALDFGLGAKIPLTTKLSMNIEGRYQHGLKDFSTHENVDADLNTLILTVGFLQRI